VPLAISGTSQRFGVNVGLDFKRLLKASIIASILLDLKASSDQK
jgi:hypothetical protein